jgi:hypothetical protein
LELIALAKLLKRENDFASNHGTMPRKATESSRLKQSVWQSWVKRSLAKVSLFANQKCLLTNRCSRIANLGFYQKLVGPQSLG